MVQILENRVVDLGLLPDKQQQELQSELRKQLDEAGYVMAAPLSYFVCVPFLI